MDKGLNLGAHLCKILMMESMASCLILFLGSVFLLLKTISNVSVEMFPEPAVVLAHNLLTRIEEFNMHSTEVNAHVKTLRTLYKRQVLNSEEADDIVQKCVHTLSLKLLRF